MNENLHIQFQEDNKECSITFCDYPFDCKSCNHILHKIQQNVLQEWIEKNQIKNALQITTYEYSLNEINSALLTIEGVNNWLDNIIPFIDIEVEDTHLTKSILLHTQLDYNDVKEEIVIKLTLIQPENKDKNNNESSVLINQNIGGDIHYQIIEANEFYNQFRSDKAINFNNYPAIFHHHWKEKSYLENIHKTESIYLYTWGMFEIKQHKFNGYYSNDFYLNRNNN